MSGKCRGELGVVFAEVVCREEYVVEVGFGEPIAECAPNAAFCESGYESELGECTNNRRVSGARVCSEPSRAQASAERQIVGDEFEEGRISVAVSV